MNLRVGALVVYGVHGAGAITARVTQEVRGEEQVMLVLALAHGLSVQLPLARAAELLRPLADSNDIAALGAILRSRDGVDADPWLKRQRTARAKLTTAVGLAEILSDGAQRDSLSPSERDLVRRAKELLASEVALSRGEDTTTACTWIDEQLAHGAR